MRLRLHLVLHLHFASALCSCTLRLQFLETIVFSLVLVTSWKPIWDLFDARNTGSDALSTTLAWAGAWLAISFFCVQVLFIARYLINFKAMVAAERTAKTGRESRIFGRLSAIPAPRLQFRLS
jgi:hypothetical protein